MDYSHATRSESHAAAGHLPNWFARALLCRTLAVTLLTMGAWVQAKAQVLVGYVANSQDGTVSLLAINTIADFSGPVGPPFFATALNGASPLLINVGNHSPVRVAATLNGDLVFVSNQGNSTITAIDTVTNQALATTIQVQPIGSGPAPQPRGIVVLQSTTTQLYVTNQGDNSVSVFDVTNIRTGTVTEVARLTTQIGPAPIEVALSPDSTRAYVLNNGTGGAGSVTVLNTTTTPPTVVTNKAVGNNPTGIAASPDGNVVYVTNRGSNTVPGSVSVLATTNFNPLVTPIPTTDPAGVAFLPTQPNQPHVAFVTNSSAGTITEIDAEQAQTPIPLVPANSRPSQITFNPNGDTAFITDPTNGQVLTVTSVDHSNGAPTAGTPSRLAVGNGPSGIALVESAPTTPVCGVSVRLPNGPSEPNAAGLCVPTSAALTMAFQINGGQAIGCTGAGNGQGPANTCNDAGSNAGGEGVVGGNQTFVASTDPPGIYSVVICRNGGTPPTCGGNPSARQAIAVPALTDPAITCTQPAVATTVPPTRQVQATSACTDTAQALANFTNPLIPLQLQMKLDWNDGTAPVTSQTTLTTPTTPAATNISGTHNYVAATSQTVTVAALDNVLNFANPASTQINVQNGLPTCAPASPAVNGFLVSLNPNCTDDDPVPQPVAKIVIDWGVSPPQTTTQTGSGVNTNASFTYPTASTQKSFTIKITATDSSGQDSSPVTMVPVTVPSFVPQGPTCNFPLAPAGSGLSVSVQVMCTATSGDTISTVTVTFDTANNVSTTVQVPANTTTYSNTFTHTYTVGGTYNLSVSATDSTGLATAAPPAATVTVSAPLPPVCSVSVSGTGGLSVAALATCKDLVSTITDITVDFGDDMVVHGTGGSLNVSQTFTHTYAVAGTYNVTVTATNSIPLTSGPATQSITVPSALVVTGPSDATVSAGGTVTYNVTLPSTFPDPHPPLTLSCTSNPPGTPLPTGMQCVFSPATIAPGGSSTLTLATNSPSPFPVGALRIPSLTGLGLALLPAILLMGAGAGRKKTGTVRLVVLCLAMSLTLFLAACGTNTPAVPSSSTTPPGTYNVLVQVTDATNTVVGSNAVTVTVK
jgi:DNA-binding beta-propeller fold protein YncE/PKD repeat protein